MPTSDDPPPPARWARLVFAYERGQVRLVAEQPVDAWAGGAGDVDVVGPDGSAASRDGWAPRPVRPGCYVDTRAADGAVLARVRAHGAFAVSAEVFPERPGDPITRVGVPDPEGAFTVVVPAPAAADHVAVVRVMPPPAGPPPGPPPGGSPSAEARELDPPTVVELGRFPLRSAP